MSHMQGQEKPLLESLIHSGVKGMKWGVRKQRSTSGEIHDARTRQRAREHRLVNATHNLNLASAGTNKAQQKSAVKKFNTAKKDLLTSEDRVVAARITSGEKWLQVVLGGPLALVTLPLMSAHARAVEKDVDKQRQSG